MQYAPPGAMGGTLQSAGNKGPTRRNPLMTFLLPLAVIFGGVILGTIVGIFASAVGTILMLLGVLGGGAWYVLLAIQMVGEIKTVTRSESFAWWPLLVPFYNYYWLWMLVPAEVAKAKQLMGVQQPSRGIVLYIFLWHFALASDINDMVR